jgi:hypothetical protein
MARKPLEEYRPTAAVSSPKDYRQLALKCRETVRTTSGEKERTYLLAQARLWDLLADRFERAPRLKSATDKPAGSPKAILPADQSAYRKRTSILPKG